MTNDECHNIGLLERLMGRFPAHDVPFLTDEPPGDGPRHLAMVLAYRGAGSAGWQIQPGRPTVQGAVEAALSRLCDRPVRVHASGRTDAGVHALGQVASFSTESRLSVERMGRGLASLVGEAVHLRALGPVPPGFHARFSARAKTYDYYLWPGSPAGLFLDGLVWPLRPRLDAAAVHAALTHCLGEVDLAAFAAQGSEVAGSTVRRVLAAELRELPEGLMRLRLTATGFLRHVVRALTGALVQVGQGRLAPAAIGEMLSAGKRLYAGPKAPPGGLYLNRVYYGEPPG